MRWQKILPILSLILLAICGYLAWNSHRQESFVKDETPNIRNELFVATYDYEEKAIEAIRYNPVSGEIVQRKKIPSDSLIHSSFNAVGSNDSVQYDPETGEIFYITNGTSDYDGSCLNSDGTCTSRIYAVTWNEERPRRIYESDTEPVQWILNPFDKSILLAYRDSFRKIDSGSGAVIYERDSPLPERMNVGELELSKNESSAFQIRAHQGQGEGALILVTIDISTGSTEEREIFKGTGLFEDTNISPDNSMVAFYANDDALYVYDLAAGKSKLVPTTGKVLNLNLRWSGDSKKLLLTHADGLVLYDVRKDELAVLEMGPERTEYVFAWASATRYLVYESGKGEVKIYDLDQRQGFDTRLMTFDPETGTPLLTIAGMCWY